MTLLFQQRLASLSQTLADTGLSGIRRGIEREALRIDSKGGLAQDPHPKALGSALTHPLITTDYAESLLEFITPVSDSVEQLLSRLRDIHQHTFQHIGEQRLWPLSMPCFFGDESDIGLADYGQSNLGKMKRTYREGLKNRYGSPMQIISGVHYNFSLPMSFWQALRTVDNDPRPLELYASEQYMGLIRNFYRYGWLVAYLYGASPALCGSFVKSAPSAFKFKGLGKGTKYLPYATSLRLSDLGYTSNEQHQLNINFNSVSEYVSSVCRAVNSHSDSFADIGVKVDGHYRQLNSNILQIENELYAPIRAKRVAKSGQTPSQALAEGGIEYIEIRALDVNPFVAEGVSEEQIRVIDALLLFCTLAPSPELDQAELALCRDNFNHIAYHGRKPDLELSIQGEQKTVSAWLDDLLEKMQLSSDLLDKGRPQADYSNALSKAKHAVEQDQTYSKRMLNLMLAQDQDNSCFGLELAAHYRQQLLAHQSCNWQNEDFLAMAKQSFIDQADIEAADALSFQAYLAEYFANACKQ